MVVSIELRYTSGSRKSWLKKVDSVDLSKTNGYAFSGNFVQNEVELSEGNIIIEKYPHGSVKNNYFSWIIYQVKENPTAKEIEIDNFDSVESKEHLELLEVFPSKKFISFRNRVHELTHTKRVNPLAGFTIEELKAELLLRGEI